ncbi:HD domain-containing protein, partial [Pseudomonadales bacterium]|nr:HD domain-containing protein [Pseudomonadales bacterium]
MLTIDSLSVELGGYLDPNQIEQVRHAYLFAEEAHKDQTRRSGEPYITHPLSVAGILSEMHMDHQCLMAALLHDVIEDTGVLKHTIGKEFGE